MEALAFRYVDKFENFSIVNINEASLAAARLREAGLGTIALQVGRLAGRGLIRYASEEMMREWNLITRDAYMINMLERVFVTAATTGEALRRGIAHEAGATLGLTHEDNEQI